MNTLWTPNFVALFTSLAYLAIGFALKWAGKPDSAELIWAAGTIPALILLMISTHRAYVRRELGVDVLALISIIGAVALGQFLTAMVISVMLVSGHALETYAQQRAAREMSALLARVPKFANLLEHGKLTQVPIDAIRPGDQLLVRSGEIVPVDGTVTSPLAMVDESALTGESTLVEHLTRDILLSGAINAGAPFEMVASASSVNSTYAGVIKLVEAAQKSKAPASRLADRYALWFVPISLSLAALAWFISGDPVRGLAVLVVATPCPLILAVPVAIISGISNCARRGILIKDGAALENLGKANILFFDKTGTLTGGGAHLVHIEAGSSVSQTEVLRMAASLDQMSGHVIAAAIVAAAKDRALVLAMPDNTQEQGGAGLTGIVEGKQVMLGAWSYVASLTAQSTEPAWIKPFLEHVAEEGGTSVFVAVEGVIIGALHLADQIRVETPRALRLLRKAGVTKIVMLTGDRQDFAETIGASIGVDEVLAEQTPGQKQAAIEAARSLGTTVMVGDGINDAPALVAADVGVAMGARGAAASSEAGDVVLLVDRLDRLAEALNTAREVRLIAIQSVVAGMAMSILAMLFAAAGLLPPLYGAVLQEVIDVAVILNALRALRIKPLRTSQHRLSAEEARKLKTEHETLAPVLDELSYLADRFMSLPPQDAKAALINLEVMLSEKLMPHERQDDSNVYPTVALLLGGDDPMAAMSRAHQEIFDLIRRLKQSIKTLSDDEPTPESRRKVQRLLYSLDAILRLHFAQEEEIYQNLG